MVLEKYDRHDFRILHYIVGECNYGGRVRDEQDRRYLLQTLAHFIQNDPPHDGLLKKTFLQSKILPSTHQDLKDIVDFIPESAGSLGLHENADTSKDLRNLKDLYQKMTSILTESDLHLTSEMKAVGGKFTEILSLLPAPFDQGLVQKSYPIRGDDSLNIVLIREIKRFNTLIAKMRSTMTSLKDSDHFAMTPDNECAAKALRNGNVPPSWLHVSYHSNKNIADYFSDFLLRINFFQNWLDEGQPIIFWMPAFFLPSAFLAAALHNYAKKWSISFCNLSFDHTVMKEEGTRPKPADGVYVGGVFCEAGQWDSEEGKLDEARRGMLSSPMPAIWFNPRDQPPARTEWREEEMDFNGRPLEEGLYHCPLYQASRDRKFLCHVALPTKVPQSHWIMRGTALIIGQEN